MTLSPLRLAETLDEWSDEGRTALTETNAKLVANGLSAADAALLASLCSQLAWAVEIQDGSGVPIGADSVHPDFAPFSAVIDKPEELTRQGRLVTNFALVYELTYREPSGTFQLVRCVDPFETAMLRLAPVGDETPFEPKPVAASPRRVVREGSDRRVVAREIGHWLIRDRDSMPSADPAFRVWAPLAGAALMRALANEVEQDLLVFRGPPLVRVALGPADAPDLAAEEFKALQESASWVYENERDLDARHGLFAAEMARTATQGAPAVDVFRRTCAAALESARIAYSLNISQVSRDSLKAMADLRKAVSDETARLADSTRTIASSVATAVFAGLGLLVARSTTAMPGWMLFGFAIVLGLYVGAVIWSGHKFIQVQADLRAQWRQRLYAFLPDADYKGLVQTPAAKAEGAFRLAAGIAIAIVVLLVLGMGYFALEGAPAPSREARTATPSAASQPSSEPPIKLPMQAHPLSSAPEVPGSAPVEAAPKPAIETVPQEGRPNPGPLPATHPVPAPPPPALSPPVPTPRSEPGPGQTAAPDIPDSLGTDGRTPNGPKSK